jgi:hypothetical protein
LRVRGLGPKRLKQLLPHLVLDPPKAPPSSPSAGSSSEPERAPNSTEPSMERQPPQPAGARPEAGSPDDAA